MNVIRPFLLGLAICSFAGLTTAGQVNKAVPASQTVVDIVSLKSGRTIRGAVIKADPVGTVTMAVSREWLRHSSPDLFQKVIAKEADQRKQVFEQLRNRLQGLLAVPPGEPQLVFFLKKEVERAEQQLKEGKADQPSQFVWVDIEHDSIAKMIHPAPDRQRAAMWAWSEQLANVETRDLHDLQRELKQRMVDSTIPPPDISDRLAPRPQDDREWAARLAIVNYTLVKPLDFQGTGDLLIRSNEDRKAVDLAPVLTKVLTSQVDTLLKDLLGDGRPGPPDNNRDWLKQATRDAAASSVTGFRATRVDVKVEGSQATVQSVFVAQMPNGNWEVVWSHVETQDATKPRVDIEAKIAGDPQVKQVLETVKALGAGADDQVRQAIRFGAATMAAQQAADAKFFEFRDRYVNHLDGPPLTWSK
ncbi:MAG: hypothetical protein JSS49_04760 [Planctomycetes bacterium]|nr:hypothetical protein [Planctomycetota bacterium]